MRLRLDFYRIIRTRGEFGLLPRRPNLLHIRDTWKEGILPEKMVVRLACRHVSGELMIDVGESCPLWVVLSLGGPELYEMSKRLNKP